MSKKKSIQITNALASHLVTQSSVSTSIAFSPNGSCQRVILEEIYKASISIEILAYTINNYKILCALIEQSCAGIRVNIIIDKKANRNNKINLKHLVEKGIHLYTCDYFNAMHVKAIIIDSKHVITGSYNYTDNAELSNLENVIMLHDNKGLAYWYGKLYEYCLSVSNQYI